MKGFVTTEEPEGSWKPGKAELHGEGKIDSRTADLEIFFLISIMY